jgi:hypothetical protein
MAKITDRDGFIDYIMGRLGAPVQEINVDIDQVNDRIDDALDYFQLYHVDGTQETFFKYTVTQADVDNGYITLQSGIVSVNRIIVGGGYGGLANWMTPVYGITFDAAFEMTNYSIIPYFITMNHLAELSFMFDNAPAIDFNKYKNQVALSGGMVAGTKIALQCNAYVDPEQYAAVWNDIWLKNYATALVKRQWGQNISLFSGVQLLGGVTLNGDKIYADAVTEIEKLEAQMDDMYSEPLMPEIG